MNLYFVALNKFADFGGRACRREYWMFTLINFLIMLAINIAGQALHSFALLALAVLFELSILIPGAAVTVRRFHDTGRSGWCLLLAFIPIIGAIILIVFLVTKSASGANKYGDAPANISAKSSGSAIIWIAASCATMCFLLAVVVGTNFMTGAVSAQREGAEYGKGKDNQACLDEAVRRYVPDHNPVAHLSDSAFVVSCLLTSKATKDFCSTVPAFSILDQKPAIAWAEAKCEERHLVGQGCEMMFTQIVSYCHVAAKK